MPELKYNTQLNTKLRIFKVYTPWEFFFGLVSAATPVIISTTIGLDANFLDSVITFVVYSLFIIYFKLGKPDGYLDHLILHLFTPTELRPGLPCPTFPIKPSNEILLNTQKLATNHALLVEDTRNLQQILIKNGIVPATAYGKYLAIDTDDTTTVNSLIQKSKDGMIFGIASKS